MKKVFIRLGFMLWFLVSVGILSLYWNSDPVPELWPGILYIWPAAGWVSLLAHKLWPENSKESK